MGMANSFPITGAEPGEHLGKLPGPRKVDPLQQAVMAGGRNDEAVVIGQTVGPLAAHHIDREVLVDHDHRQNCRAVSVGLVGMLVAAKDRIGSQIGVQRGLELRLEVPAGDPPQDLPPFRRKARVASSASPPTLFEQLVTNTHAHHHGPPR